MKRRQSRKMTTPHALVKKDARQAVRKDELEEARNSLLSYVFDVSDTSGAWKVSDIVTTRTINDQICIEREVCDIQGGDVTVWGTVEVYRGPALPDEELAKLMAIKAGAQRYV